MDSGAIIYGYEPVISKQGYRENLTQVYEAALLEKLCKEKVAAKKEKVMETIFSTCHFFSISESKKSDPS